MTVRDWLELLMVPLAIAVVGLWFAAHQDARQQQIEDRRAASDRQIAEQSAQEDALQAYLDQMSTLLLDKDLRTSDEDSEVRTLARARTLVVLERLDPSRKTQVMEFLVEEELVGGVDGEVPIVPLSGADLSGPYQVTGGGADLGGAWLNGADLSGANLRLAYLVDAGLDGADLSGADLSDAKGVTNEELEQQAVSLVEATMPNGQKCEDWLKSKGREEDGQTLVLRNERRYLRFLTSRHERYSSSRSNSSCSSSHALSGMARRSSRYWGAKKALECSSASLGSIGRPRRASSSRTAAISSGYVRRTTLATCSSSERRPAAKNGSPAATPKLSTITSPPRAVLATT